MKDEIKEILEALKPQDEEFTKAGIKKYPLSLSLREQKLLLDYITNLQEENKKMEDKFNKSMKLLEYLNENDLIQDEYSYTNLCELRGDD